MISRKRVVFDSVPGSEDLFTPEFTEYLAALYDRFAPVIQTLRLKRAEVLVRALSKGQLPSHLPESEINTGGWQVPPVPEDLKQPGIEITGPASITNMFINALNPGPGGIRAEGDLDDDEDAAGHRFVDTVTAAHNRVHAAEGTLEYFDHVREREYKVEPGKIPFFMHRERGIHLDEPDVTIDGHPVPAAILGTALTLYHCGMSQMKQGQGVYFYLPKLESAEEAALWRDFFDFSMRHLPVPDDAVIKAIPLVESLPAAYQMEEILYALGPYAAGLNAARWDFKASIFEFVMADPSSVWPDRFGVDIKTTDFIANIFRRLVAICLKRGAVPIGGMATALPSKDEKVNQAAGDSIRNDKEWEAQQGFLRGWVAHIFHMDTAANPFKELRASGWTPTPEMADPDKYPIEIKVPDGPITIGGTRRNARMVIEYLEGWLNGRGAKGIDSLEGKPGLHGALMEDLATGRMSVAQIAQRVLHGARDTESGEAHDFTLIKRIFNEEVKDILSIRKEETRDTDQALAGQEERYRKAYKIALQWIKNYTDYDFRSLGSYTRTELDTIAASDDAF